MENGKLFRSTLNAASFTYCKHNDGLFSATIEIFAVMVFDDASVSVLFESSYFFAIPVSTNRYSSPRSSNKGNNVGEYLSCPFDFFSILHLS